MQQKPRLGVIITRNSKRGYDSVRRPPYNWFALWSVAVTWLRKKLSLRGKTFPPQFIAMGLGRGNKSNESTSFVILFFFTLTITSSEGEVKEIEAFLEEEEGWNELLHDWERM